MLWVKYLFVSVCEEVLPSLYREQSEMVMPCLKGEL